MDAFPDAVPTKLPHDTETVREGDRLHRSADIGDMIAWTHRFNAAPERLACRVHKFFCLRADLPYRDRAGGIDDIPLMNESEIKSDDVSRFQYTVPRNAVHDLIIYGHAERRRIGIGGAAMSVI